MQDENVKEDDSKTQEVERTEVGFPETPKLKKKSYGALFLVILALVIAGFFAYSLFFSGESQDKFVKEDVPSPTIEQVQEVSPTPKATSVNRKDLKVNILNGTGIPGKAGELKVKVESLGYDDITTGNATSYDYELTEVSFSDVVSKDLQEEITNLLKKTYGDINTKSTKTDFDINIIIGVNKVTSTTPTPKTTSVTPTRTSNTTLTPTLTPTPTI